MPTHVPVEFGFTDKVRDDSLAGFTLGQMPFESCCPSLLVGKTLTRFRFYRYDSQAAHYFAFFFAISRRVSSLTPNSVQYVAMLGFFASSGEVYRIVPCHFWRESGSRSIDKTSCTLFFQPKMACAKIGCACHGVLYG